MWGKGVEGQMGTNEFSIDARPTPTHVDAIPAFVTAHSVGRAHCAAIAGVCRGPGPCPAAPQ